MKDRGAAILGWWRRHMRPEEDTAAARALRARLRRADNPVEILAERAVFGLSEDLPWLRSRPEALARLATVLAGVKTHRNRRLAAILGAGDSPPLSALRFQRLIRTDAAGLPTALRRALGMTEGGCDVAALGRDILDWDDPERGEKTRIDWCFDYFGAARPAAPLETEGTTDT